MRPPKPVKPDHIETRGLTWRPSKMRWTAYWLPRQDLAARGYPIKSRHLWPPSDRPEAIPAAEDWHKLSLACEKLQNEMLTWASGGVRGPMSDKYVAAEHFNGTVSSLIDVFMQDPASPFKEVRYDTTQSYEQRLETIRAAHGQDIVSIARDDKTGHVTTTPTFHDFSRWYREWRDPEGENRISHAYEHMKFVRIIFRYGALVQLPGCAGASAILSGMELENPKRRETVVTEQQSVAIRGAAHDLNLPSVAFAQAMQHALIVRQKDVIGELIPREFPGLSDVIIGRFKWVRGFRWEEVDDQFTLAHRISKTIRGRHGLANPDAGLLKRWNLWLYPPIIQELCRMAGVPRAQLQRSLFPASGPMIVSERSGRPWHRKAFGNRWRQAATKAGVPATVQSRDNRAGGATDADEKGADLNRTKAADQIRPALGHSKASTSLIYLRGEDAATARIAHIRFGVPEQDE